jgi:integrase
VPLPIAGVQTPSKPRRTPSRCRVPAALVRRSYPRASLAGTGQPGSVLQSGHRSKADPWGRTTVHLLAVGPCHAAAPVVRKLAGHAAIKTTHKYYVTARDQDMAQARDVTPDAPLVDAKQPRQWDSTTMTELSGDYNVLPRNALR